MLFDLRGRGRRRTVQAIYLSLAILMGGGLVLFGIGSNTSGGGIVDAVVGEGSGGDSATETLDKRIKARYAKTRADADASPAAWAELARLRFQRASIDGIAADDLTYTEKGKARLTLAADGLGALPRARSQAAQPARRAADGAGLLGHRAQRAGQGRAGDGDRDGGRGPAEREPLRAARAARLPGRRRRAPATSRPTARSSSRTPKDRKILRARLDQIKSRARPGPRRPPAGTPDPSSRRPTAGDRRLRARPLGSPEPHPPL